MSTPELTPEALEALPEGFSLDVANLSDVGEIQLIEAINHAAELDSLDQSSIDSATTAAEYADMHRETIVDLQEQREVALADGDLQGAADAAQDIVWELQTVDGYGGDVDGQLIQAENDLSHYESAVDNAQTADSYVDFAATLDTPEGVAGALDTADMYASSAATDIAATDHSYDAVTPMDDASAV